MTVHEYRARCSWSGSTVAGYDSYSRAHTLECPPAPAQLAMSGDPAFRGVAARARIDVLAYEDDAEADMPRDIRPMRITAIRLRPRITVAEGTDEAKVQRLVALAHQECFIASSVTSEMD